MAEEFVNKRKTKVKKHMRKTPSGKVVPVREHQRTVKSVKNEILKKSRSKKTDITRLLTDLDFKLSALRGGSSVSSPFFFMNDFELIDSLKNKKLQDKFAERIAEITLREDKLRRDLIKDKIELREAKKKAENIRLDKAGVRADIIEILENKAEKEQLLKDLE